MRSRYIKPGFFINEQLAECSAFARLLFTGLWCLADREGRLEDKPRRIKAQVFPYDDLDADALLNQLAAQNLIIRYEVDGAKYIEIPTFNKHQTPHKNETASVIPPAPKSDQCLTKEQPWSVQVPTMDSSSTDHGQYEDGPRTVRVRADNGILDTDNGIPELDNGIPELDNGIPGTDNGDPEKNKTLSMSNDILVPRGQPPCPCSEIAEAYNTQLPELLPVLKLTEARKRTLRARWREDKERQSISWWIGFWENVKRSDWLMGRCPPTRGRDSPWQADFDWLLKPTNLQKVLEGKYRNKPDVFEQAIAHGYTGFGGSLRDLVDVEVT